MLWASYARDIPGDMSADSPSIQCRPNRNWKIEQERWRVRVLTAGIATGNDRLIGIGLRALGEVFQHYNKATGFPGSSNKTDRLQSLAFFLGPLLQAYDVTREFRLDSSRQSVLNSYLDQLRDEARELGSQLSWLLVNNVRAANRMFIIVRCFAFMQKYYGTPGYLNNYIRAAVSLQTRTGFFLESGGYDVSYQAASLSAASMTLFAHDTTSLRQSIVFGYEWLSQFVDRSGNVALGDSTRTAGQETYLGHTKLPNKVGIQDSLVIGSAVTKNPDLLLKARAVAARL